MNCLQHGSCQNTICLKMLKRKLYVFLLFCGCELLQVHAGGTRGGAAGWSTALWTRRSQVRLGVIRIFHWHNSSGRTVAMGLAQPLREMSVGEGGRCVALTTLPPSCSYCFEIWKPQPPSLLLLVMAKFNVGKITKALGGNFTRFMYYVYMYVCMYACMYVCMYVCLFVCLYVCMYACAHMCVCVCALSSTHTWQQIVGMHIGS
jgi:hypothetical protein